MSDIPHVEGQPLNTEPRWGKDPKFSWWEKLVIVAIVVAVGAFIFNALKAKWDRDHATTPPDNAIEGK